MTSFKRFGVVGGGAWGTALASAAVRAGGKVLLWARADHVVADINDNHRNDMFLPGIDLDPTLRATGDLSALDDCDALLLATPAQSLREVTGRLRSHVPPTVPMLVCCKGIEQESGKLMTCLLGEICPQACPVVLSGPGFAMDVAMALPTAVTLACADDVIGHALCTALSSPTFRLYFSRDVIGAQIGGAVKNVLAIACGVAEGRKLGASARAALTARGFAELTRFGIALGARAGTMAGLSGLGDLVLTCNAEQSRNMSLGIELGRGRPLRDILKERQSVSEGVYTAYAVIRLAREHGVDMPICAAVHDLVTGIHDVDEAIRSLLLRPLKDE